MRKLMFLIKDSLKYHRFRLLFTLVLYLVSIIAGIIFFRNEHIPIDPKSLALGRILLNNGLTLGLIIVVGLVTFGILGNFITIANGLTLGRTLIGVFNIYGISPLLDYVAPHFLFEMMALLLATCLSQETYKVYYNLKHVDIKVIRLKYCLVNFCFMVLFFLIAALIESQLGQ